MTQEDLIYSFRKELQNLGYCKGMVTNYPKYAERLLEFTQKKITKITSEHILLYHHYLKSKPAKYKKKRISESHIFTQLHAIKSFFDYLQRIGTIKVNPYTLKLKSPPKGVRDILSQEQIKQLYHHCKTLEQKTILHLCYGCGLRRLEARDLEVKDINFEKKLLFVRNGKGKKRRVIPITGTIAKDLKKYCQITNIHRGKEQQQFLITAQARPMQGWTISISFKKILEQAKITNQKLNITLHSLRHSIATHLLENEMSIEMVRNFLGHQQLRTTQIYTRVNLQKLK
jgi:integrase/recombinase XerD